jgi:hypothetical protein
MTPAPKPPSVRAFEERARKAAWHGLFGTAERATCARSYPERAEALKRVALYVSRLKEMGVKAPEENP